ncbi:trafficking protein particle complex subunit 9-like [Clavelina lepadiformis]|uniref:trafficking protein particle complex subunit 9-like n=1 Tax=Clavelina lepadiformis TaxID=159417 RepID=UPI004041BAF4
MSDTSYKASPHNHLEILIAVHCEGNLTDSELNAALAKLKRYSKVTVADAGRTVHFRFERKSPLKNSEWGYFQAHRRAMGLVMLAGCSTAIDVALLHETFQKKKEVMADYIFDARCFVFGIDNALYLQQSKSEVFQFPDVQSWKTSDRDMKDFLTSIFYILESKRLQLAADKSDRPTLLVTPFEKSQSSSSDNDSRNYRKKCLGRWKKHLGDISLLAGLKREALQSYHAALDLLISANDPVWIGGVLEGLCVVTTVVMFSASTSMPKSPVAKAANKQVLDPRNLVSSKLTSTSSNDELEKFCIQTPDDFVDRYKEAVINYSKSMHMGVVEFEACIKATKVMALLKKAMQAAEFLQNAVYIALKVSDEERILKYSVLADLYDDIGFHRKSAFYRRVAAMQCVAPQLEQPNWHKCYNLLQGTLKGYNLKLYNDNGIPENTNDTVFNGKFSEFGWPQVRLRVLYELVFSSRRIGNNRTANRLMAYLLTRMHSHLTESEEKEACSTLEFYSHKTNEVYRKKYEDILATLNLYTLPVATEVNPQPLLQSLLPILLNPCQQSKSVFLFTPLSYQSAQDHLQHADFRWCVNSPAEVQINFHNPLQVHSLHVSGIKLMCEESDKNQLECHTVSLDIPAGTSVNTTLVVIPKLSGSITITGYEVHVFGIVSHCLFADMAWVSIDKYEVDVLPEMPVLELNEECFLQSFDVSTIQSKLRLTLYPGERHVLEVPFTNKSNKPISHIDVEIPPIKVKNYVASKFKSSMSPMAMMKSNWLEIKCTGWENCLPLDPHTSATLPIVIKVGGSNQDKLFDSQSSNCVVKVKYSGLEAAEQNWGRSLPVEFVATLKPCFIISDISVKHNSKQGWCNISIELSNVSDYNVTIFSAKLTEQNTDQPDDTKQKETSLTLAQLNQDESTVLKFSMESIVFNESVEDQRVSSRLIDESKQHRIDTQRQLRQTFNDAIDLQWKTKNRNGALNLSSFSLSVENVINLLRPPLYWDFIFNDVPLLHNSEVIALVGDPHPININMTNITGALLTIVDVELEIFQDQYNGFREWNMEDLVLCVGCQNQCFENIEPGKTVEFRCTLIFLLMGHYHVRLRRNSSHCGSVYEVWTEGVKRTLSNQTTSELFNYREFSPEIVVVANES